MKNPIQGLIFIALLSSCAPYKKGPVFTEEIAEQTFGPVVEFMEAEPGMAIADVGAGSGALTVGMATQLENSTIFIQDIDPETLDQGNVDKMITYYFGQQKHGLTHPNEFHLVYGNFKESNLPNDSLDIIYSSAVMHVFDYPNEMLQDLKKKLKPSGKLFIRDGFHGDHGNGEFCSDPDCGKRLYSMEELIEMMNTNGYSLIKKTPDSLNYRILGFQVSK